MGARRDDDPGALEALLLAPVGVGAATPAELAHLQDRLRRREAALRAVLEGLPDATVARGQRRPDRVRQRARRGVVRIRTRRAARPARPGAVAGARCASATRATWSSTSRPSTRCGSRSAPTACAATAREFVGEMSWGIVETEAGPAAAGDRARHDRAPRGDGAGSSASRARRRRWPALGERALSGADVGDLAAEAVERMRETLRSMRAVIRATGELAGRAGGTDGGEPAAVRDPHRRGGLRRDLRRRRGRARRGRGELPARDRERARDRAGAAARRGADAPRGAARSADRAGQPRAVPRAADPRAGAHRPRRGLGLRAVHRPRRLQGGQRPLRARRGRRAADRARRGGWCHGPPGGHRRAARRRRVRRRLRGHRRAHGDRARACA